MSKTRIAMQLTLVLAVAFSAVAFFIPTDAKAACWYPKRVTTTYYGYIWNGSYSCTWGVSPQAPYGVVGERITECDGSVYQWGIECDARDTTLERCDPICE